VASDHFAVMAGIGLDAMIMQGTNEDLKKAVGSAAYFVAAARNARHPALHTTIELDDEEPVTRRAHVIVIGNVGYLQANIQLIPDAKADDGQLDVVIASPRSLRDWVRLTTRVLTRQRRSDNQLDRLTGQRVKITVDPPDQYQMDGDTVGECSSMLAEVQPGALLLRVPRAARRELLAAPTAATLTRPMTAASPAAPNSENPPLPNSETPAVPNSEIPAAANSATPAVKSATPAAANSVARHAATQ
jgi:diacylglycerol kinase (ATP)